MVVGEKGAKSLDAAEEVTTRIDNLAVADEMEKAGKDALTIKAATGWERGADGKWRYEIPDITLKKDSLGGNEIEAFYGNDKRSAISRPIEEVVVISFLPDTYREELEYVGEVRIYSDPLESEKGSYQIEDGSDIFYINLADSGESIESVITHELQHFIQDREGFSKGGNPEMSINAYLKQKGKYEEYQKLLDSNGKYSKTLHKILSEDKEYVKNERIARALDRAFDMIPPDESDDKVENFLKEFIPGWEKGVNYDTLADKRKEEIIKEHKDELEEAREADKETAKKIQDSQATLPTSYEAYRRLAGEVESRAAGRRFGLTLEERRNSLFTDEMYKDVAKEDLIFLQDGLTQMESRKQTPRYTKNDTSAFHLSRNNNEVTNDIFKILSERKYKKEIQTFVKGLPANTYRTSGIWYLSKDGKRVFRINTSVENFEENKRETSYGFEVVDWYNLGKLNSEQLNLVENGYKKNDRVLSSLLTQYESEQRSLYNSDSLLSNGETNRNNDGLDKEAPSGETFRGRDNQSGRGNQGTDFLNNSDLQTFTTSFGEVYGFIDPKTLHMYLDEDKITPEHPLHEYTHIWHRNLSII